MYNTLFTEQILLNNIQIIQYIKQSTAYYHDMKLYTLKR